VKSAPNSISAAQRTGGMTGSSDEYEVSDADPDAGSNSDCDGESDYNPRASGSTSRAQVSQSQSQKGRAATSAGGGMGKAKSGKAGMKTKTKKSRPAPNEFRIQGALKAYRTSTYTTSSLVGMSSSLGIRHWHLVAWKEVLIKCFWSSLLRYDPDGSNRP
jgi:hypothetical protein